MWFLVLFKERLGKEIAGKNNNIAYQFCKSLLALQCFIKLSYSKIIITPASKAWWYIRVILSVFPSICPPDCTIVSISFLSKWTIRSFYCPPWLLKTWGCVIIMTQGHLGKVQCHWEEECTMRVRTIYLLSVKMNFLSHTMIAFNLCHYLVP